MEKKTTANGEKESINSQRLPKHFTAIPDLLLSTSKNNQRTNKISFAPNLNAKRNKNNNDDKSNDKDSKKEPVNKRNLRNRDAKPNTTNRRNNNTIVQTAGFLSEGLAATLPSRRGGGEGSGFSSTREVAAAEVLSKPRLIKREAKQTKEDYDKEQKTLLDLLADDDMEDDDYKTSDDIVPIKIKNHLKHNSTVVSKSLSELKIKVEKSEDDFVKNESTEFSNGFPEIKTEPGIEVIKSEEFYRLDDLFNADPTRLMLFQLPDTLPGTLPDDDEEQDKKDASEEATPNDKSKGPKLCTLQHLSEGLIGKLIRHKSGKTKLLIGDSVYDIDNGLKCDFQQNAVIIDSNIEQRSSSVYSLGEIQSKYNVSPDWNWLFENMMNSGT